MHHIQRKILSKLLYAAALPYTGMRPEGVESNHFAYHLEQLLTAGYIIKNDKQYTLSPKGLATVDRLSQEHMTERLQPHIVTAVDITNEAGQTLLFKRSFQPYIHLMGFPLGKTHYQEDIAAAAGRELAEKTGLRDIPLVQRGIVYVEAMQGDVVISKILCHVFQGSVAGAPTVTPLAEHRGECIWLDHTAIPAAQLMPGFLAIKKLLATEQSGMFFSEIHETVA